MALLCAVPTPDPVQHKTRILLKGDIPTPLNPPSGCVFHTRCPIAQFPICKDVVPPLIEHKPGQFAACHFAGEPVPAAAAPSWFGRLLWSVGDATLTQVAAFTSPEATRTVAGGRARSARPPDRGRL